MSSKPNEQLRHEWRKSLEHGRGLQRSTIAAKLAALRSFEDFSAKRSFLKLNKTQVAAFKERLLTTQSTVTGERLSCSTVVHMLDHCRDFFEWLADQKEGRKLDREAVSWFTATRADKERARAVPPRPVPTLDEAQAAFAGMPSETLLQRRDRAVFALLLLTAIRADALASLTLGAVDLKTNSIWQDSRTVRTKNAKSFSVFFLPFVAAAREVFEAWILELRALDLASSDALFPRSAELLRLDAGEHFASGAFPVWQGSSQVRAIVRGAFKGANLPAYGPHVFRHMFARHVLALRPAAEEIIAFSVNLGHRKIETTLSAYARPDEERRGILISQLGTRPALAESGDIDALMAKLIAFEPKKAAKIVVELAKR